jgi:quercetin dioxygenase-like cupin family protein
MAGIGFASLCGEQRTPLLSTIFGVLVFICGDRRQLPVNVIVAHRVVSRKDRGEHDEQRAAPETKGVTVKLLATMDLGPEIEGMTGRQLRMRIVTIETGGVLGPIHDHKDRSGIAYTLQGTITDHRNGIGTDYGPGVGWPEDRNTTHSLENRGTIPAIEISVDIFRLELVHNQRHVDNAGKVAVCRL